MAYYVGIDLGGTNIVAGVVDDSYKIIAKASCPTACPRPAEEIIGDMAQMAEKAVAEAGITLDEVEWVGVGTPGVANRESGVVEYANNLGWVNVALSAPLNEKLGRPVYIDNDANVAAYGEFLAGAAKGVSHAIVITLGTGVGGGIIIDGKIYSGFNFAGAELGHAVIEVDGVPCTCGRKGCLEAYASATGLIRMTNEAIESNPNSLLALVAKEHGKTSARTAFDAMRAGDTLAKSIVDSYISYLACGMTNFINIFQPEILCIGGGVCNEGETLLAPLREIVERDSYSKYTKRQTVIKVAALGNDAGLIGAALVGKCDNRSAT